MSYSNDTLAHRLKVLRAERHMSQDDLAKVSGISINAIARYETGITTPRLDAAYALANALESSIDDLAGLPAPDHREIG